MFMPLDFLLWLLSSLVSIAILGGGIYILYEWYEGELVSDRWLYLGAGLLLWSFFGFLPILLLRRSGRDSTVWYYAKKQLTSQFRVIVWDLPGLGKSKKPKNRDYSLEKYARDLNAVLDVAGDQPVILLGHSMGAMILLTFSRLFPEQLGQRVAGVVLVDGTYTNPLKTTILSKKLLLALQKLLLEPLLHLAIALSPLLWLTSWLSYLNGSTLLTTEISGFTGRETRGQLNFSSLVGIKASPGVLARGVLAMLRFDETATLPTISVPTLPVVGNSDIATRLFASDRMSAEIPQAELRVISPGGHMVLMARNQQFSDIIAEFSEFIFERNSIA